MEAAHVVGLEAPAKGTLEPPVGSDLDGGGCLAALQGVSGAAAFFADPSAASLSGKGSRRAAAAA